MPRIARPHWSRSKKLWYAAVGPAGANGRATEVYFRAAFGGVEPPSGPGDERQAFRWLDAYLNRRRRAIAAAGRPTVRKVFADYLAWCGKRAEGSKAARKEYPNLVTRLARVSARLGDRKADALSADDHESVMGALRGEGLSPSYIRGIHRTWMAALNWAARPVPGRKGKLLAENPLAGIRPPKVPRVRGRYVGRDELGQFFVWAAGRCRYLHRNARHFERVFLRYWLFTLATGCRPGEAIGLRWDQVDWKRKVAVLAEHKTARVTGGDKIIPLPPRALRILRRIGADPRRHATHCFPCRAAKRLGRASDESRLRGNPWSSSQAAARALRRLRRLAIAVGCELVDEGPGRLIGYSGRYRSVTDKLGAGLTKELVARIHGHSPDMVEGVYEQLEEERLSAMLAELERRGG